MITEPSKLSLSTILEDLFLVLGPKEKEVIIRRFSLDNQPKYTLEKIGEKFGVTRERVRQIEKIALSKLKRVIENSKLTSIHKIAQRILTDQGGLSHEDLLLSKILMELAADSVESDIYIIRLALAVCPDFDNVDKKMICHPFWHLKEISEGEVEIICDAIHAVLNKKKDVVPLDLLAAEVEEYLQSKGRTAEKETILSAVEIDKRFKKTKDGVGLMTWRYINPKSIRDKAYICLKQHGKPLHFVEIANKILAAGFDKKTVTTQAVHNELIRNDLFVLVGRGLYALKDWGYKSGTVSDVIVNILKKKSPLSKKDIVEEVLKQRHVKKGTISLNLQKNSHFVRVGRAMYALKS